MMKILFGGLLLASITASGQTNSFPSSGNVRINTTNSDANLTMDGTILVGGYTANLDVASPNSGFNNLANSAKMLIGWNKSAGEGETDFVSNRGAGAAGGFAFYDYSNTGVIAGLLRIYGNGMLRGKEIQVDNYFWPDFVFEAKYKLITLAKTESYIKKNGHLPDMPSAAEVVKDGVKLGEISAKLLQKIEELTLHLIEKDKQLKLHENRLLKQEQKSRKLEKLLLSKIGNHK